MTPGEMWAGSGEEREREGSVVPPPPRIIASSSDLCKIFSL
jgi:hypothetical protein